jgi:glutaredoxin
MLALYEVIRHFGLCPFCKHAETIDTEWEVECKAFAKGFHRPKVFCAKFEVRQDFAEKLIKVMTGRL